MTHKHVKILFVFFCSTYIYTFSLSFQFGWDVNFSTGRLISTKNVKWCYIWNGSRVSDKIFTFLRFCKTIHIWYPGVIIHKTKQNGTQSVHSDTSMRAALSHSFGAILLLFPRAFFPVSVCVKSYIYFPSHLTDSPVKGPDQTVCLRAFWVTLFPAILVPIQRNSGQIQ